MGVRLVGKGHAPQHEVAAYNRRNATWRVLSVRDAVGEQRRCIMNGVGSVAHYIDYGSARYEASLSKCVVRDSNLGIRDPVQQRSWTKVCLAGYGPN